MRAMWLRQSVMRLGLSIGNLVECRSEPFNACPLTAEPQILSTRELLR
jgi:hypothetical protein